MASTNMPRYSMSFTTGALLRPESLIVAALFAELGDWNTVRAHVLAENRLQMRTANASRRVCREVVSRLKLLTPPQLEIVRSGAHQEQGYMLWLAVCKRYRFIHDFAVEVLREKFLRLDLALTYADYDIFFGRKAEWRPEVESVAPATRKKQRQLVFKMLREAGLLSSDGRIVPVLPLPALPAAVLQDNPAWFSVFPISEREVVRWTR